MQRGDIVRIRSHPWRVVLLLLAGCTADTFTSPDSGDAALDGASDVVTQDASISDASDASSDASPPEGGKGKVDANVGDADAGDGAAASKVVFVTSATYSSNLGGLNGADTKCQTLATSANLTGTFRAWLSDSTTAASSRLTHATVPYVLTDGTLVAADWNGLTSGTLQAAILLTEAKGVPPTSATTCGTSAVWTGSSTSGSPAGAYCANWAGVALDGGTGGVAGNATSTSNNWTDDCTAACTGQAALYCIEQ